MSWKDHLTPDERQELHLIEAERAKVVSAYNAIWRRLKARCDARQRRLAVRFEEKHDPTSSNS